MTQAGCKHGRIKLSAFFGTLRVKASCERVLAILIRLVLHEPPWLREIAIFETKDYSIFDSAYCAWM